MHICFVCREYLPSLRGGGIASYIKEVVYGLHILGHQITVICASDNTYNESDDIIDGVRVIRLKGGDFIISHTEKISFLRKFRPFYRFWSYRKRIVNTINNLDNIDIIEVPEFGAESYFLHQLNIPIVIRLHTPMLLDHYNFSKFPLSISNWYYYWQGLQELKLMKETRYITSCSSSLKEWAEQFVKIQKNRIQVIYNPIDVKTWKRYQRNITYNKVKEILFAGTICDWKGCGDLAEACHLLNQRQPELQFRLSLIGKTGAYAGLLQKKYSKESWFNLVGKVKREELMQRYTTADLICFPSWWENMPMVCIEAMLCGCIVLGSKSGGMSEIIEDGKSGFLIEPRNATLLSSKIESTLNISNDKLTSISKSAKETILQKFSCEIILNQMTEYYQKCIINYKNQ